MSPKAEVTNISAQGFWLLVTGRVESIEDPSTFPLISQVGA